MGHGCRFSFMVVSWSLWAFVGVWSAVWLLFVAVSGHCGQSLPFTVWVAVVGHCVWCGWW